MNMQMITCALLIYRLTGSAAILGLMALATALPMLLLSLFGGAIADRVQKKHIIQAGQAASAEDTQTGLVLCYDVDRGVILAAVSGKVERVSCDGSLAEIQTIIPLGEQLYSLHRGGLRGPHKIEDFVG